MGLWQWVAICYIYDRYKMDMMPSGETIQFTILRRHSERRISVKCRLVLNGSSVVVISLSTRF